MSDIRWEGLTHDEIYEAVHQGPGAAVSKPAEDAWKETEALILRIDERIASAMAGSQSTWEGSAADATRSAMTPLGQWALDAARNAKLTAGAVTGQGLQANYVRENMPEPVTEQRNAMIGDALTDPTYIFHGLDDLQAVEQDGANRAARAVELMNTYTDNSEGNRRFWVAAPFPPQVTVVTSAEPPGQGGPAPTLPADVAPSPGSAPVIAPPTAVPPPPPGPPAGAPASGPGAAPTGTPPAQVPVTAVPPPFVPRAPGRPPRGNPPATGPAAAPTGRVGTQPAGTSVAPPSGPGTSAPVRPGTTPPRPVVPTPPRPAPPPTWRDVIPGGPPASGTRFPGPAAPGPDQALPPGARTTSEPGGRAIPEQAARAAAPPAPAGSRPPAPGAIGGLYPPLAAGMAARPEQERRRPDYLLDDSGAFVDDRWFTPAVITPDDGPPVRR